MFTLYLCLLIFAGILLIVSMVGGFHGADSDFDHNFDSSHSIGDGDFETSAHDISHSLIDNSSISENSPSVTDVVKFFSFRNIIFFLAFFGLTGTVLDLLKIGPIFTFISSFLMGSFSAGLGYQFMKYLKNSETGTDDTIEKLIGKMGRVELPVTKKRNGKVLLESQGQYFEIQALLAESEDEEILKKGEKIMVLEIINNVAYIVKNDL